MKPQGLFFLLTLALAPLTGAAAVVETKGASTPPPATTSDTAAKLSEPVREVVKMATAGVPDDVLKAYIANSSATFNLSSDSIISLQGMGVSGAVTAAMLSHDKAFYDNNIAQGQAQIQTQAAAQAAQQQNVEPPLTYQQPAYAYNNTPPPYYNDATPDYPYYPYYNSGGYGWPVAFGFSAFPWGFNNGFFNNDFNHGFHHGFNHGFNHGFGHQGFNHGFNSKPFAPVAGFNHGFSSGGFHGGFNGGFGGGFHGGGGHMGGGGFHGGGGGSHGGTKVLPTND